MGQEEAGMQVVDGSRNLAIEIKAQRELALSKPRNERAIFEMALQELDLAPEFAEDAYYSIPFEDKRTGEKKPVEGLSVVASRAIARRWTNCAAGSRVSSEDDKAFEVEGIFADFETNVFFRKTVRVPKTFIPRGTGIATPLRDDRLNMAIQAGMSKAERNATLAALPEYLKVRYFEKAKTVALAQMKKGGKSFEELVAKSFAAFEKLGLSRARFDLYLKATEGQEKDKILQELRGLYNAVKDGQVAISNAFPEGKKSEAAAGAGPVSAESLTGKPKEPEL